MLAAPVGAQEPLVVVELFTSQGCSSCPPADALMHKLAARDDVLPLALHVDYWDYIGWKDEYADPAHARRQKGYARRAGRNMVYTPQMIINGQQDIVGTDAMALADLIAGHRDAPQSVSLTATRTGRDVVIRVAPLAGVVIDPQTGPFDLVVVRYALLRHANITRGENAGQMLDYANVVEAWITLGQWDGQAAVEVGFTLDSDSPAAVVVQHHDLGPIVAAVRVD